MGKASDCVHEQVAKRIANVRFTNFCPWKEQAFRRRGIARTKNSQDIVLNMKFAVRGKIFHSER
ncbi:hypothetical protein DXA91_11015 [Clostridium sp. OF09-10]|nr:hypothetical protein DXA91_11015 [Clostridium sp. OF09-10]